MLKNTLLLTDVYKWGHMNQYNPDTVYIYSYLEARKKDKKTLFYGLQYYLINYLEGLVVTHKDVDEALKYRKMILGTEAPEDVVNKYRSLADLGYLPIIIKAVPEGTIIDSQNILLSIENTIEGFHWVVGYLESLILKLWNTISVATYSMQCRLLVEKYAKETCDNTDHIPYQVHDFGYRGVSSEETAILSGSAHLLSFLGTDTVPAVEMIDKIYTSEKTIGCSVSATEHSVACSYGIDGELDYIKRMLDIHPTGVVSVVSDTYDYYRVLTEYIPELKDLIMSRDGKLVIRPDSCEKTQVELLLGDPEAEEGSPKHKGTFQILWELFGGSVNSKGYKVLDSHIGVIYGDGFFYDRFVTTLEAMKEKGFATSNLVIGMGGLLLQQHSRDDLGFAFKATKATLKNKETRSLFKCPATDKSKKSKTGYMALSYDFGKEEYYTKVDVDKYEEQYKNLLQPVFRDGVVLKNYTFDDIRAKYESNLKKLLDM